VRLFVVRNVNDVCGGEIKGDGSVIRFCCKPPDVCKVAGHIRRKALVKPGHLYPRVFKKEEQQVRLEPSLPLIMIPPTEVLNSLLLEVRPIALWQTYMDACKATEFATGRNEQGVFESEEEVVILFDEAAPSLRQLESADDFKTPKKVRMVEGLTQDSEESYVEPASIGSISPLNIDLSDMEPLADPDISTERKAVRKILLEWDRLGQSFGDIKLRLASHEDAGTLMRENFIEQFQECNYFMNDLGNKTRLCCQHVLERMAAQTELKRQFGKLWEFFKKKWMYWEAVLTNSRRIWIRFWGLGLCRKCE
jgi:hypothetical protein